MQRARRRTVAADVPPGPVFVDSGGWIALAHARDRHHEDADRLFHLAAARRLALITTNLVVAEVHRLLLFRAGPRVASTVLDRIDGSGLLGVEFATAAHHVAARTWLARLADQAVTYTDAVSFAVMQSRRCRAVLGFDHHFISAGFMLWQS